jgi:hypothetical protein
MHQAARKVWSLAVSAQTAHMSLVDSDNGLFQETVVQHRTQNQSNAQCGNDGDIGELEGFHDFPHNRSCDFIATMDPAIRAGDSPDTSRAPQRGPSMYALRQVRKKHNTQAGGSRKLFSNFQMKFTFSQQKARS